MFRKKSLKQLREVLASSHVAAIAIAFLLFASLGSFFSAVAPLAWKGLVYAVTAIAILDIPYFSWTRWDQVDAITTSWYLFFSVMNFVNAWLLSHWSFGIGPLRCMRQYQERYFRSHNA